VLADPIDGLGHFILAAKKGRKIEFKKNKLLGQTMVCRQLGQAEGNKL